MADLKNKFLRIIIYSDLNPLRVVLCLSEALWGVALLWPGDSFMRGTYAGLQMLMPSEEVWGGVWLFSACCQLLVLLTGNYHSAASVLFAGFNMVLWWYVVVSMYLVFWPPAAAISGEVVLAVGAAWVFVRSGWVPRGGRSHAF